MVTDEQGNRYYTLDDAKTVLEKSRSVVLKMIAQADLPKFRIEGDKHIYYRVTDIEALKRKPRQVRQVGGKPIGEIDTSRQPAA